MCMFAVVILIVGEPETFLVMAGLELGYHEGVCRGGTDVLLPAAHTAVRAAGRWGRDHVPDAFPTERCLQTTAKDISGCDLDRDFDLHDFCVDPLRIEWPIGFQDTYCGRARFPTVERRRAWPVSSISIISSTSSITTRSLDHSTLLFDTSRWVQTFPSLASARSDLDKRSTLRSPMESYPDPPSPRWASWVTVRRGTTTSPPLSTFSRPPRKLKNITSEPSSS